MFSSLIALTKLNFEVVLNESLFPKSESRKFTACTRVPLPPLNLEVENAESPSSASNSLIAPKIVLAVVVSVVFAREEPTSESNILRSVDKEFNALPVVFLSALSLNPPSLPALSAIKLVSDAPPEVCNSFIAAVRVFVFVVKVVCGLAPISLSNSFIAPTISESIIVVNLPVAPTSLDIVFILVVT